MNLAANGLVLTAEGEDLGLVAGLGIDLDTNQVVEFLVRRFGHQAGSSVLPVPIQSVAAIEDDEIQLMLKAPQCRRLTELPFPPTQSVERAAATGRALALHYLPFGMPVACADGKIGTLARVLYDQYSYAIEELTIVGEGLEHEVSVPVAWVRRFERHRIMLSSTCSEMHGMPAAPEDL